MTSELFDDHGQVVVDTDGELVLVVAAWETWKMNWLPNVLLLLAAAVLLRFFWLEIVARHFKTDEVASQHQAHPTCRHFTDFS